MDQAVGATPTRATSPDNQDRRWIIGIAITLALILLVNPVGFLGGGWDDWQYLNAARCWVEHGPCLPRDHWQGRWPVIAPIAAMIALFGEGRLTIGLPSLIYAIGCLLLLARLGNRLAGRPIGHVAALVLLVMPVFGVELLSPNAEHPELFFLLAAANLIQAYAERPSARLAFGAGLSWSLALQVRETAITALPLLAIAAWVLARRDLRSLAVAALGALSLLVVELVVFAAATGDPFWRRGLSIAHAQVPSTELIGRVDTSRSPIFNPDYIAAWRHQPGVQLHWAIDGLANLLVNAMAGLGILFAIVLSALFWRRLEPSGRRIAGWCMAAALYWACVPIYVLAIDPNPRMMFVPVALTALAFAILLRSLAQTGSARLAVATLAVCWLAGMTNILLRPHFRTSEVAAARWAVRFPGAIETDETTRRHLALQPAAKFADLSSDRPMLALKLDIDCRKWADRHFPARLDLTARSPFGLLDGIVPGERGNLCLFRYRSPLTSWEISVAKAKSALPIH